MMRSKHIAVWVALWLQGLTVGIMAQQVREWEQEVARIEQEAGMQHATVAVCVYNTATQTAVYQHNADRSVTPASVAKLFTTGAGFAQLGADFRFKTRLSIRGEVDRAGVLHGDLYITGSGDPLLGSYRYKQTSPDTLFEGWMRALRDKGVRRVYGHVCYNTSVFDNQPLHDNWQWGDIGNYYASGVSGLNFHENMYFVYFAPGKQQGQPATVARLQPRNLDIYSVCEVTTAGEQTGDSVTIYGSPTSKERIYKGTIPAGKDNFMVRGAMPNPAKTCADQFATYMRTHGIGITSTSMQVNADPDSLRPVLDYSSNTYYVIAQYTNLTSNNLYAESIFKYLGYKKFGQGSFANGSRAVNSYFSNLGLQPEGTKVVDGSGLSRLNHTTANFLCQYLAALQREDYYDKFMQTLPKAGDSGTARNLLPSLPKGVSVRVKTGTMSGIKSYAGYITTRSGETYSFAIIGNDYECTDRAAGEKLSRLLLKIASSL